MINETDIINIDDRNAYDSWYGYHYQSICAILYFLEEVNKNFNEGKDPNSICLRIEYIEDFIIFNDSIPIKIFQAKKTLTKTIMKEVYKDFLLERILLKDKTTKYIIVSDNKIDKLSLAEMKEVYNEKLEKEYINQLDLVIKNINNKSYLSKNLKIRNSTSKLKNIRQIANNILAKNLKISRVDLSKLKKDDFKDYLLNDIKELKKEIIRFKTESDMEKFYDFIENSQAEINKLEDSIDQEIENMKKYKKMGLKNNEDIRASLVQLVYKKLKLRVKDKEKYTIMYSEIEKVLLAEKTNEHIWNRVVYNGRNFLKEKMDDICKPCLGSKDLECDNYDCIVNKIQYMNFEKSVDNFNLELPKNSIEYIVEAVSNKVSKDKIKFFKLLLLELKKNKNIELDINEKKDIIKFLTNDKELAMLSWLDSFDYREDLIANKAGHMDIYMEYDEILTKEYEEEIDFNNGNIIKDDYEDEYVSPCGNKNTFFKGANIKFVSYENYRE